MNCLTCGHWTATHGLQCEMCAMGEGGPDEASAQSDSQYDDFVNEQIEAQRLAHVDEQMCVVRSVLDQLRLGVITQHQCIAAIREAVL